MLPLQEDAEVPIATADVAADDQRLLVVAPGSDPDAGTAGVIELRPTPATLETPVKDPRASRPSGRGFPRREVDPQPRRPYIVDIAAEKLAVGPPLEEHALGRDPRPTVEKLLGAVDLNVDEIGPDQRGRVAQKRRLDADRQKAALAPACADRRHVAARRDVGVQPIHALAEVEHRRPEDVRLRAERVVGCLDRRRGIGDAIVRHAEVVDGVVDSAALEHCSHGVAGQLRELVAHLQDVVLHRLVAEPGDIPVAELVGQIEHMALGRGHPAQLRRLNPLDTFACGRGIKDVLLERFLPQPR